MKSFILRAVIESLNKNNTRSPFLNSIFTIFKNFKVHMVKIDCCNIFTFAMDIIQSHVKFIGD
jgi:hypothetical protein